MLKRLKEKPKTPEERRVLKKEPVRCPSYGLPVGGAHLRVSQAQVQGVAVGSPCDDCGGQSHVCGYGSPDLQRLHEILHLPETGAGRYPSG